MTTPNALVFTTVAFFFAPIPTIRTHSFTICTQLVVVLVGVGHGDFHVRSERGEDVRVDLREDFRALFGNFAMNDT